MHHWYRSTFEQICRQRASEPIPASEDPELPFLSPSRSWAITPPPSQDGSASLLVQQQQQEEGSRSSSFFLRLPSEIRRQVLIAAFGHRTVHCHLTLRHPPPPRDPAEKNLPDRPLAHCYIDTSAAMGMRNIGDMTAPKVWCWSSSVCHRLKLSLDPRAHKCIYANQPCADMCQMGYGRCYLWPGESPDKCFLGVMGWLLSCRQAYREGIDILFSCNTFHMSSMPLITNLPSLILPQRLAAIKSLEILLAIPESSTDGEIYPKDAEGRRIPSNEIRQRAAASESGLLSYVDGMVRAYGPRYVDCDVALAGKVFQPLVNEARRRGDRMCQDRSWIFGGFWRSVPEEYPKAGYWVVMGQDDAILVRAMSTRPRGELTAALRGHLT